MLERYHDGDRLSAPWLYKLKAGVAAWPPVRPEQPKQERSAAQVIAAAAKPNGTYVPFRELAPAHGDAQQRLSAATPALSSALAWEQTPLEVLRGPVARAADERR